MRSWLLKNFWLKAISLVLAIITWFYVVGELSHKSERVDVTIPIERSR